MTQIPGDSGSFEKKAIFSKVCDKTGNLAPVLVKGSILGVSDIKTAVMSVTSSGKT